MSLIINFFRGVMLRLVLLVSALAALGYMIPKLLMALFSGKGSLKERVAGVLTSPMGQRANFAILRCFWPNIVLKWQVITAYENKGTAVVTRYVDVKEVIGREGDFAVVYEPRMRLITGGENFFLGMQNTAQYTRDTSNMRLCMRRDDVPLRVQPFFARKSLELVTAARSNRIDVPQELTLRVPAQMLGDYFGTPGPSEREVIEWTTMMFWYLFIDLKADPKVGAKALEAARACCAYLDETIRARKASGEERDDVLGRCLVLQKTGTPGMEDINIRNNLIGLMIGAVPTISKAAVQALDQLLERPEILAGAQAAARADDDALLSQYVFEAMRFNPVNPVIYRRAVRDTQIARGTLRQRHIPAGTMVLAANLSAMFDPLWLESPSSFKTDRPWNNYILWGDGMHTCFGAQINAVAIPGVLKPLLKKQGLRRAAGDAGQIDTGGTPFPVHMTVQWD